MPDNYQITKEAKGADIQGQTRERLSVATEPSTHGRYGTDRHHGNECPRHVHLRFGAAPRPLYQHSAAPTLSGSEFGLASDVDELGIVPDYSGTSTAEVLTQITRAIIERGRPTTIRRSIPPLAVLRYAQFPKIEPEHMERGVTNRVPIPTWVPDWRNNLTHGFESTQGVDRLYAPYGNSSKAEVVPTSTPMSLGFGDIVLI